MPISDAEFEALPDAKPSGGGGIGQALESGARALSMGVPFSDRIVAGAKSLPVVGTGKGYSQNLEEERSKRQELSQKHPYATAAGEAAGGAFSSLALGGMGAGASLGERVGAGIVGGGLYGGLQGASEAQDLTNPKDVLSKASKGAAVGGAIGGTVPLATDLGSRAISPFTIHPERQRQLDVLEREGIESSAGQATGSRPLKYVESTLSELPGSGGGMAQIEERQKRQLATAAGRRAGMTTELTPERMLDRYEQFNREYEALTARNTMPVDQPLEQSLVDTLHNYRRSVNPSQERPVVENTVRDIQLGGQLHGNMPGRQYENVRSGLRRQIETLTLSDPPAAQALREIRDAMHDAMGRGMPTGSEDAQAWGRIDREYANYKALEAAKPDAFGRLSAGSLRSALSAGKTGRGRYSRGQQDLAELARAADAILQTTQSGLAPRVEALRAIGLIGGGGFAGGSLGGLPGAIAGAAVPGLAGRAMMTRPMQNYLRNQAAVGMRSPQAMPYERAATGAAAGMSLQYAPEDNEQK